MPVKVSVLLNDAVFPFVTVKVPVLLVIVRPLIVLFVKASDPARVASVPVVGSVTFVAPVLVRVIEFAPLVTKLPPSVIVLLPLFTPVPPFVPAICPVIPTVIEPAPFVMAIFVPAVIVAATGFTPVLPIRI